VSGCSLCLGTDDDFQFKRNSEEHQQAALANEVSVLKNSMGSLKQKLDDKIRPKVELIERKHEAEKAALWGADMASGSSDIEAERAVYEWK